MSDQVISAFGDFRGFEPHLEALTIEAVEQTFSRPKRVRGLGFVDIHCQLSAYYLGMVRG